MKTKFTLVLLCAFTMISAQKISDFENYDLQENSFLNGSLGETFFESGHIHLQNVYDAEFDFWTGWAISNTTDTITPGFTNQYSAIPFGGVEGSLNFAVGYASAPVVMNLKKEKERSVINGMYVTNSTYAYLSMKDGDAFAKKFGGPTGDDADYFLLTIRKWLDGSLSQDSIDFYLADFRFDNQEEDYIIDAWEYIDLSDLGWVDSLQFSLRSTDVGQFGMNTPAYFCVDNIEVTSITSTQNIIPAADIEVFPNPSSGVIYVSDNLHSFQHYALFSLDGSMVDQGEMNKNTIKMNPISINEGAYILTMMSEKYIVTKKILIQ